MKALYLIAVLALVLAGVGLGFVLSDIARDLCP